MNLVTNQLYREETLDTSSDESAVSAALEQAQDLIEEYLRRPLVSEERTESLHVYPDGSVYPEATPITVAAGYTIERGGWLSGGTGTYDFLAGSTGFREITYTGGYTIATLPKTIRKAIAWTAYYDLHPTSDSVSLSQVPVGASSVSLGDASVSFGSGGAGGAASGIPEVIADGPLKRWIRREP